MNFLDNKVQLGLSEKKDGPMKNFPARCLSFFKSNKLADKLIISAGLVHQDGVVDVSKINESFDIPNCDALLTNNKNQLLTITVADCLPVYFYDNKKQLVALAHAGWRGVVLEIVEKVIDKMAVNYSSQPADIEVFIGPHIRSCHFEVKDDVASQFPTAHLIKRESGTYLNLAEVVKQQLLDSGLLEKNIEVSQECTYCLSDKYFSYRRDKPERLETMLAYIGLK